MAFVRYAKAVCDDAAERRAYYYYSAEQMRLRGEGRYITMRLWDIIHPTVEPNADEIVSDVIQRGGLEVVHEPA